MSVESESAKRYHGKEGLLFLSSLALLLSPFIKIGGPITVKIKEFLEIPVEVSDALPAIAFFYLSTLALAFYVFVEWRRLETSERKTIQNWSFAAFETIAVLALYWRYSDLLKNTPYGKFSPLWFAPFLIVGFLFGMAFSMFRFAFSLMRTREEAKRKNLPRIPRQAKEMIAGNCLMILLILLPATIAAFYFYPGPTRWVPSVLLLLAVVPGLPAFDFAKVDHSDGTRPLDKLKAVTDWSDHMERAAVLFDRDSSAKEFARPQFLC